MVRSSKLFYALILLTLLFILAACALRRDESQTLDADQVNGGIPPTLAPLGADSSELSEDVSNGATAVNVDPTATTSSLGAGAAGDNPEEPTLPTSQPVDLSGENVTTDNGAEASAETSASGEEAAVAPEKFIPPAEEASSIEPIIVDATNETLPSGGPIAVNPPASQTEGNYAVPNAAPVPGDGADYLVQPGDTLFNLGLAYGTTVDAIVQANGLTSETIYSGQTLRIPGYDGTYTIPAFAPTFPGSSGGDYVVDEGDTLFNIAIRYGISVEAIAVANGIPAPYIIYPQQSLTIPDFSDTTSYASGVTGDTHTVAPGETIFFIAQRYGVTTQAIVAANSLSNPNQIQAGQVLTLP